MDTSTKVKYVLDFLVLGTVVFAAHTGNMAGAVGGLGVFFIGRTLDQLGDEIKFNRSVA